MSYAALAAPLRQVIHLWYAYCMRRDPVCGREEDRNCWGEVCPARTAACDPSGTCTHVPMPTRDKCKLAEAQFMVLMLNYCQGRIADSTPIRSRCTSNTTVGQSRAQADALLCNPSRSQTACKLAECESQEINTGRALATD